MSPSTTALIMAGGRSQRMRDTAGPVHKALVPVLGVPLLERNVCRLLSEGIRDIVVAVATGEREVENHVVGRCRSLAAARQASVRCVREDDPLGTVGLAGTLGTSADQLLIVCVDNLTTLGLQDLLAHHRRVGAALTVATHRESFRLPFGQVSVSGGRIEAYHEKPERSIHVSSGVYVLGRDARARIRPGRATDLPDLVSDMIAGGVPVESFEHQALWIDVNDAQAHARAESMVAAHAAAFDLWQATPDGEVAALVAHSSGRILVQRRDAGERYAHSWDLPGSDLPSKEASAWSTIRQSSAGSLRRAGSSLRFLVSFDDLDSGSGRLIRHHVLQTEAGPQTEGVYPDDWAWVPIADPGSLRRVSPPVLRALAAFRVARSAAKRAGRRAPAARNAFRSLSP